MAARNIKLTIHYDGSAYHGWQTQPDVPTVQEHIHNAVEKLFGKAVRIVGASRTDAGVSALGQVASIKVDTPIPTENIAKAITESLPDDIVVVDAEDVHSKFNAITSAAKKLYCYTIFTGSTRPVMDIKHCWHYPYELDVEQMNKAAKLLIGKKDFKSFASASDTRQSSIRTILKCEVSSKDKWVYVDVEADGFLYNMVRNIVGTLVEIGRDRWTPEKITDIIEAKDRTAAGPLAPAAGLCLMKIDYTF
ncbi:MAG: tRNA pseudouridine(38-40) synthase TruA [Sedimentisphaerales bacterium]|nr:tRNA pseudouridine(38-40) synthase TruA [Sedimentisphaerales bacterium]